MADFLSRLLAQRDTEITLVDPRDHSEIWTIPSSEGSDATAERIAVVQGERDRLEDTIAPLEWSVDELRD